jgi:23S rRNA (pseudouridine1915-N3)-methyltransferase
MKLLLGTISTRRGGMTGPAAELLQLYVERSARYTPCESRVFASGDKFLSFLDDSASRTRPSVFLADSTGQQLSSPELALALSGAFDAGTQLLVLAIGPADGWSLAARKRADKLIAFGRITLPHELAAVVAAEQIYRALTIRAGHPYHSGH